MKIVASRLLTKGQLYTTSQILVEFNKNALVSPLAPSSLQAWLVTQPDWVRVGLDQWLPRNQLPQMSQPRRYAVRAVAGSALAFEPINSVDRVEAVEVEASNIPSSTDTEDKFQVEEALPAQISWKITLRTWHLNEGILSVPITAHHLYPRARKLSSIVAIPALWFEDNTNLTIWLDKTQHKLFGPDLQDKLDYLGAGVMLEIRWTYAGLTMTQIGENPSVAEEESRLIDLSSLNDVRSERLESYRSTLRLILTNGPHSFNDLYEELCIRQQHHTNKNTVRSILSSSPEFNFDQSLKQWKLNPAFSEQFGAKTLRRTILVTQASNNSKKEELPYTLSTVISTNKQKLTEFREKIFKNSL